jgi:UDP-apiose/xylose synthase
MTSSSHPSPRSIAVLGAGGFLGSHLVERLLSEGWGPILAVDRRLSKLGVHSERLVRLEGALPDPALLERVVDSCACVASLTALCNPSLYNTEPLEVIDANYTDLVPLVRLCAERGRRLVHFSTCEVYGRGPGDAPMTEDATPLVLGPIDRERWTYACAKQLLERQIWAFGRLRGLEFSIIRPFNVIGPRMDFLPGVDGEGIPRVLACFMKALLWNEPLKLVDGGQSRRAFTAVEDFTDAVLRLLERREASRGQIFNLGNPANDVTIAELARLLADVYRAEVDPAARPIFQSVSAEAFYGPGYDDVSRRIPDIAKARQRLGWEPTTSLAAMLPPIVRDYVARYPREPRP